jgi:serine/threonine-protein kinase HipA
MVWKVSPVYDLIFSTGPAGEHCTMIMGEGKNPGISHLLKLAEIASIDSKKALEIIDQVRGAINQWKDFASLAQVTSTSTHRIQSALDSIDKLS